MLSGRTVPYTLKRSFRARNLRIEIRPETGLTVVLPAGYNPGDIEYFLKKKSRWILKHLDDCAALNSSDCPAELHTGDSVPYLGRMLEITVHAGESHPYVEMYESRLFINTGRNGDNPQQLLDDWYKRRAYAVLPSLVAGLSSKMNLPFNRLFIRGQKTRWGSCSHQRNISLNWKLVKMPEGVITYVIVHELAHLREMNHTARFWEIVAAWCPDWRESRLFLKKYPAG